MYATGSKVDGTRICERGQLAHAETDRAFMLCSCMAVCITGKVLYSPRLHLRVRPSQALCASLLSSLLKGEFAS
jgi:hypothetical protein